MSGKFLTFAGEYEKCSALLTSSQSEASSGVLKIHTISILDSKLGREQGEVFYTLFSETGSHCVELSSQLLDLQEVREEQETQISIGDFFLLPCL